MDAQFAQVAEMRGTLIRAFTLPELRKEEGIQDTMGAIRGRAQRLVGQAAH